VSPDWEDTGPLADGVLVDAIVDVTGADQLSRWRARVLRAGMGVTRNGVVAPPLPAHGPWRRLQAGWSAGDVRTSADEDADGVADASDNSTTTTASGIAATRNSPAGPAPSSVPAISPSSALRTERAAPAIPVELRARGRARPST
jgi:hypothetical protein